MSEQTEVDGEELARDTISIRISLLSNDGVLRRAANRTATFDGNETFEEIFKVAQALFPHVKLVALKIGQKKSKAITSFRGIETFRKYLQCNGIYPSHSHIYCIAGTEVPAEEPTEDTTMRQDTVHVEVVMAKEGTQEVRDEKETAPIAGTVKIGDKDAMASVPKIPLASIQKQEQIGKGAQANVYRALWNGTEVALKESVFASEYLADAVMEVLQEEITLHASLRHPNVLPFFGLARDDTSVYMITEKMDMSLDTIIFTKRRYSELKRKQKLFIAQEMIKGLIYLHDNSIVHADVKPANVLLSKDMTSVKLCDMGLSRVKRTMVESATQSPVKGTYLFMAPELLSSGIRSTFATDVWAAGGTICELFTGTSLWEVPKRISELRPAMEKNLSSGNLPTAMKTLQASDRKMGKALVGVFAHDPSCRLTASELLEKLQKA